VNIIWTKLINYLMKEQQDEKMKKIIKNYPPKRDKLHNANCSEGRLNDGEI